MSIIPSRTMCIRVVLFALATGAALLTNTPQALGQG
jgi:hypothetical protein